MPMNKLLTFSFALLLASCGGSPRGDWVGEYTPAPLSKPTQITYTALRPDTTARNIAVLLPTTGPNAAAGDTIRDAIEAAILQRAPRNLTVSFYDTGNNAKNAIATALTTNPDIIIGPLFSENARALRGTKPITTPALAFTSDITAVGDGVISMALIPTNGTEAIVQEMNRDGIHNFIILAPDTESGHLIAGAATAAADAYDMRLNGVFYYTEHNTNNIKETATKASMYNARSAANTRAKEILSDILTTQRLTTLEKSSLARQLETISRDETLGKLPYEAVLFLGDGNDAKSLASFLRYYGVGSHDVRFYGTAMWSGADLASDITMSGAKFSAMPEISEGFKTLYQQTSGVSPSALAAFGYDAANMALNTLYASESGTTYLLNPSGYTGTSGLFRLMADGNNERALQIMQLNASGAPRTVRYAASNFMTPIYSLEPHRIRAADSMDLETRGINPTDYIQIPERFKSEYKSKTYGKNITRNESDDVVKTDVITVLPKNDSKTISATPDFKPVKTESIKRTYIDSVVIEE